MKKTCGVASFLCCLAVSLPLAAQESKVAEAAQDNIDLSKGETSADIDLSDPGSPEAGDSAKKDRSATAAKSARFTLGHEVSFGTVGRREVVNNRSWFRIEYSKFFLDSFYVQLDSKLNGFWAKDHRAKAEDRHALFETNTQEAFLQYSGADGHTSLRAGVQRLIWGESEAGAITDEVSPRNFSELFFVPLEESRIGQFMFNLDYFSAQGDWSFFFVPSPKFNKYPITGTAYYIDPFNGQADYRDESPGKKYEYGMRWKKTFGKSDISFMAASLLDNDYALRLDGSGSAGKMMFSRLKERFTLAGVTFNYAQGNYLVKGEVALKSSKAFNDAAFQIIKKDVVASSLGLTYSLGQSNSVGVEVVNTHVNKWNDKIVSLPKNTNSLVLNANLFFLNDNLSVNWLTIYSQPYTSYQSSIRTSYKWRSDTTFSLDLHAVAVPDKNSGLYGYRDQDQIVFRVQHQF